MVQTILFEVQLEGCGWKSSCSLTPVRYKSPTFRPHHFTRPQSNDAFCVSLIKFSQTTTMSDYEDEMDIDVPPACNDILFNSDNTNSKGKRSAANLPVEAEDSLPWYAPRRVFGLIWTLIVLIGSKSTVLKPSRTSQVIKTFLPP
jgi:hypothetical protein